MNQNTKENIETQIIDLEKAALERWGRGDPSGFLEICADEVVYIDPYLERRIDGLAALKEYYEKLRGKVRFDRFELHNAKVQENRGVAVLTFNYISYTGQNADRWNCTEVYRLFDERWKIVQTHWSYTQVFKYKCIQKGNDR